MESDLKKISDKVYQNIINSQTFQEAGYCRDEQSVEDGRSDEKHAVKPCNAIWSIGFNLQLKFNSSESKQAQVKIS